MWLNAGVLGAEQLLGTLNGDVFYNVYALAAAVVALAREALSIFVGQYSAHRQHNSFRDDVLGSDQFDVAFLAGIFRLNRLADLGIMLGDKIHDFFDHVKALLRKNSSGKRR